MSNFQVLTKALFNHSALFSSSWSLMLKSSSRCFLFSPSPSSAPSPPTPICIYWSSSSYLEGRGRGSSLQTVNFLRVQEYSVSSNSLLFHVLQPAFIVFYIFFVFLHIQNSFYVNFFNWQFYLLRIVSINLMNKFMALFLGDFKGLCIYQDQSANFCK